MVLGLLWSCQPKQTGTTGTGSSSDAASRVYVAPGQYDEFYAFLSGGFSGQVSVYGLPSGRLLKVIPVFSVDAEKGYGFNEETKPMLQTSFGILPWDDAHHPELSPTGNTCLSTGTTRPGSQRSTFRPSKRPRSSRSRTAGVTTARLSLRKIQST